MSGGASGGGPAICHARDVRVNLDTTFARTVWLDPVPRPPTPGETSDLEHLVPGGRVVDHREQLIQGAAIVIYPEGADPWVLAVRHDAHAVPAARLVVTPDSRQLVVFEGGDAACFVVALEDGALIRRLELERVTQVLSLRGPDLLVLVEEYSTVAAFGREGFLWQVQQDVLDDIQVLRRDGDHLDARAYGYFGDVEFSIDVRTGATRDLRYLDG
jgi:hypothetical protein